MRCLKRDPVQSDIQYTLVHIACLLNGPTRRRIHKGEGTDAVQIPSEI